jgi:hypothetical protein
MKRILLKLSLETQYDFETDKNVVRLSVETGVIGECFKTAFGDSFRVTDYNSTVCQFPEYSSVQEFKELLTDLINKLVE